MNKTEIRDQMAAELVDAVGEEDDTDALAAELADRAVDEQIEQKTEEIDTSTGAPTITIGQTTFTRTRSIKKENFSPFYLFETVYEGAVAASAPEPIIFGCATLATLKSIVDGFSETIGNKTGFVYAVGYEEWKQTEGRLTESQIQDAVREELDTRETDWDIADEDFEQIFQDLEDLKSLRRKPGDEVTQVEFLERYIDPSDMSPTSFVFS